ncbi:MAG: Asp-tRNA(Asn)/Glu-tRNA(Gln) amidotransferase subunit GatC [Firmicutes bacterium]|nr:Asp-tRNA(Asn)/Glu-tRNA(Gln) amidotransferase subunit GatC [Candidatus Fermentithermobacillaceae bacterium]HON87143.1 Asp-tRNA(Asn)/Glu-tRNA(Gln) amidotransferase subunit GatC [Bacillota bacterium]HOV65995.1 Asp-tRNA(Asn)/Glu-tRNA(Gln) amidotransferase subunit GatC [Bacillota bacterium]HRC53024.1 Asp-tRNA(Asn)/Glu-tRNA(Gln) amidotransferase subunit GatC [Bacillota bacterium]
MELDITRLAHDAGITLPEEYKDDLANDLTSLLEHMKHLLKVDLEGYEPTFSMVESQQLRLFDDVVEQTLSSEVLFETAPSVDERYFKVPRESQGS